MIFLLILTFFKSKLPPEDEDISINLSEFSGSGFNIHFGNLFDLALAPQDNIKNTHF